jgi:EAL domain-containing protein (putative c-di-GMP-specific phosphodiesterase class I)
LEITESVLMEHEDDAISRLTTLRQVGVHLAIDDFGTGYSSLSALRRLPVHLLKIDRSFITNLADNDQDTSIAWTIVRAGAPVGHDRSCRGGRDCHAACFLRDLGCDRAQGYLSTARSRRTLLRAN